MQKIMYKCTSCGKILDEDHIYSPCENCLLCFYCSAIVEEIIEEKKEEEKCEKSL